MIRETLNNGPKRENPIEITSRPVYLIITTHLIHVDNHEMEKKKNEIKKQKYVVVATNVTVTLSGSKDDLYRGMIEYCSS